MINIWWNNLRKGKAKYILMMEEKGQSRVFLKETKN